MPQRIVLPERICIPAGSAEAPEQFHIYFRHAVIGLSADETVRIICDYGRQYREYWRIEPGAAATSGCSLSAGEFLLCLQVLNLELAVVAEKQTVIEIVPAELPAPCSVLCIGDSITRNGTYVAKVQDKLPGLRSAGLRTYDNGRVNREGRGGWTALNYLTRLGEADGGDSPFLFPKGVAGERYRGNVSFWSSVVHGDPDGYAYQGFQRAACAPAEDISTRVADPNEAIQSGVDLCYGIDGYPLYPQPGDLVCDPERKLGTLLRQWNGQEWEAVHQDPGFEADYGKYLSRNRGLLNLLEREGKPDIVTLLFGANEFQLVDGIGGSIDSYLDSLQRLIDMIHSHAPDTGIIINLPLGGADQDSWGIQLGCRALGIRYLRNIQEAALRVLERWDNEESRKKGIRICPMLLVLDPEYGFDHRWEPANKYTDVQVRRHSNWVHPNDAGHAQMADALLPVICSIARGAE
ncbi:MAG: hydrolase family protein [Paenibacillaceae bacterium]|nr:hydrolase family protein [Paenibacillaceae bacterium]